MTTGFTVTYPQLLAQMAANGLDDPQLGWFNGVETYKQVKDFKWHRAQASPNWCLLPSRDTSNDALAEADFAKADEEEMGSSRSGRSVTAVEPSLATPREYK